MISRIIVLPRSILIREDDGGVHGRTRGTRSVIVAMTRRDPIVVAVVEFAIMAVASQRRHRLRLPFLAIEAAPDSPAAADDDDSSPPPGSDDDGDDDGDGGCGMVDHGRIMMATPM